MTTDPGLGTVREFTANGQYFNVDALLDPRVDEAASDDAKRVDPDGDVIGLELFLDEFKCLGISFGA